MIERPGYTGTLAVTFVIFPRSFPFSFPIVGSESAVQQQTKFSKDFFKIVKIEQSKVELYMQEIKRFCSTCFDNSLRQGIERLQKTKVRDINRKVVNNLYY